MDLVMSRILSGPLKFYHGPLVVRGTPIGDHYSKIFHMHLLRFDAFQQFAYQYSEEFTNLSFS